MDLKTSFVTSTYSSSRSATAPQPGSGDGISKSVENAAESFLTTLKESENTALQAMSGGADPHALVQAIAQSELAVETAVTVRDKVVEAYQEILRMPI